MREETFKLISMACQSLNGSRVRLRSASGAIHCYQIDVGRVPLCFSRTSVLRRVQQSLLPAGLHERAGSLSVLHLHGEIRKSRSTLDPTLVTHLGDGDIHLGDRCAQGSQLRPHIVWFGESVPAMEEAAELVREADVVIVVGTSLVVYPAASLVFEARKDARRIVVNPDIPPG